MTQLGNVGGQPYWSWYGFEGRVEWCACFVSWCANECGYIDSGVIPKYALCSDCVNWFKDRGQWRTIPPSRQQDKSSSLIGTMKTDRMAFPTIRELLRKSRTASFTPLRVILATPANRNNILSDIMKSSVTVSLPIKTRNKNRNRLYNRRFQYIYYIFAT